MDFSLDADEVRALGSLLEKEVTTPEYYPLSLNALLNACNQKSNRDPVVHFDEDTIERVVYTLRDKGLLLNITGAGSRVPKYGHRLSEKLNLGRRELAILCELMVRGPQTLGELRMRAERMHPFDDLAEVEAVLDRMPELVTKLPRRQCECPSPQSGPASVCRGHWRVYPRRIGTTCFSSRQLETFFEGPWK